MKIRSILTLAITLAASLLAPQSQAVAADFFTAIQHQGTTIMLGKSGPVFTDFLDPDCPFCHVEFLHLQQLVSAGKIRLQVVPVAVIDAGSLPRIVTLLQSKDPSQALLHAEQGFHDGHIGVAKAKKVPTAIAIQIQNNNDLLAAIDPNREIPVLAFRDQAAGGQTATLVGLQPSAVLARAIAAAG